MLGQRMDSNAIRGWLAVLDELSYYELLGIDSHAGADQIRRGFYRFAETFHPDGHATRPSPERTAINTIFMRGTEAYRVLSDAALRYRYDEARSQGNERARLVTMQPLPASAKSFRAPPPSLKPSQPAGAATDPTAALTGKLADYVRQPRARPFAQQAEALAKNKEYAKAKLQLKLAINMDPGNPALDGYMKELEEQIREAKGPGRR